MKKVVYYIWPYIVLALTCLLVISIWFKDGKLLATGEEGLILSNPGQAIHLYSSSWNELGLGNAYPGVNTQVPFLTVVERINKLGVPIWQIQAGTFFLLMLIGVIGSYLVTVELFKSHRLTAFIASFFYLFNPISLMGVWYRFALSFEFFYALMPLFFYLYLIGLRRRWRILLVVLPLVTMLFSFIYSAPALTLLIWLLPFLYSVVTVWQNPQPWLSRRLGPLIYFTGMLGFWAGINLWWILPYVNLSQFAFSSEISPVHAIGTLKANSLDFGVANIVRLIHGGFYYRGEAFGSIYKRPFFLLLSWLIPIVTFYGLYKLKGGFIKTFFIVSIILMLFSVKGTSPPFGGVFLWFFTHITFLQVYRNPLEKIGMVLPTIYAPLFSFGLLVLLNKVKDRVRQNSLLVVALVLIGINCWPFFTGGIVHFQKRDIRVEVPSSFVAANKAIPPGNHVIFSLPAMGGASGRYKWPSGYAGVESSEYLFNYPVIVKFYDAQAFYAQILIGLSHNKMESNLVSLAQLFSADIIAFRKDTDVVAFGEHLDGLVRSEQMIKRANLKQLFDSKEVSLWSIPADKIVPIIYTPKSIKTGDSPQDLISLIEGGKFNGLTDVYLCLKPDKCSPFDPSVNNSEINVEAVPESVEFEKISPSEYKIKIKNSTGKFLLVFNNSYHPGWRVNLDSQHIVANGYANGFMIDKTGSYDLTLRFQPQQTLERSITVSRYFILLGLLVLLASGLYKAYKLIIRYK